MTSGAFATKPVPLVAVTGSLLLGGASTFLLNLGRAFAQRGQTLPVVVLSETNEHAEDFARAGHPVHEVPGSKLIYEDRLLAGYRAVAHYEPRAVLACLGGESFEILRLVPKGVVRMGVVQSHEPGPYALMRRYAPWLDAAVGVSRVVEQELASMPELKQARAEYIPYGIAFGAAPAPRSFDSRQPLRLIYLGRLIEEQKRISRLVELVRLLDQSRVNVTLTIAGAGPDESALRRDLAGVSWVHLTGAVPNAQTGALLDQSDVFVLLSDYEGLPLSLLEAMGRGVVPLVSDLPSGMREVVTDACGFRVPVGDVGRAAEIITRLAVQPEELISRSTHSCRMARERYSADRMAGRYLELIESLQKPAVRWPEEVAIPAPLGLKPWLYSGIMRKVRRGLRPFVRR